MTAATSSRIKAPATPRTHRVIRTERILLPLLRAAGLPATPHELRAAAPDRYSARNLIEAAAETNYFQIGESKYGKPIIDRATAAEN